MASPVSPITGDYFSGKGRLYFRLTGATRLEEIGDVDDFSISLENERLERFSNQYGTRTKTDTRLQQQNATISFTCAQNTARNMAIVFGAEKTFKTQVQVTGSYTHNSVQAGDIVDLGALDVTLYSIRGDNTPTGAYATGNYELDSRAGILKILSIPTAAAAMTGIDVSFDKAAITGSAGRLDVGLGSSPDLEGTIIFVGLDTDNNPVEKITLHKVKLSPNGDINFISDEYRVLPVQGDVIADTSQAVGFYLGKLEDLSARTNRGVADA
jgi:hypothetical protein